MNDEREEVIQFVAADDIPAEVWIGLELAGLPRCLSPEQVEAIAVDDIIYTVSLEDDTQDDSGGEVFLRSAFVVTEVEGDSILCLWLEDPEAEFEFDRAFIAEVVVSVEQSEEGTGDAGGHQPRQ